MVLMAGMISIPVRLLEKERKFENSLQKKLSLYTL